MFETGPCAETRDHVADAGLLAGQPVKALAASEQAEQHGTQCRPAVDGGASLGEDAAPIATATVMATTSRRRCMGKVDPSGPPQSSGRTSLRACSRAWCARSERSSRSRTAGYASSPRSWRRSAIPSRSTVSADGRRRRRGAGVRRRPETLARTTLGRLGAGGPVNIEPALRAGEPLGGHYVQGHVDGVGRVASVEEEGDGKRVWVDTPAELLRYCVEKGSIAVDGV